jgi:integrative and conjugative element protein (TIGR02256 family)
MLRRLSTERVVWRTDDGAVGSLAVPAVKELSNWRQRSFLAREAGGVLLGFLGEESNGLLVEQCTVPSNGDRRSRYSFYRGPQHQMQAEKWHQNTHGYGTQLGLWHTHPEPIPTPSSVDIDDYQQVFHTGINLPRNLLFLIVGTKQMGFWLGCRDEQLLHIGYIPL